MITIDTSTIDRYEDRIRSAYQRVLAQQGKRSGAWVSLTDLRPEVGGHRPHVDAALRRMGSGGYRGLDGSTTYLIPESNQKALSDCDREAALSMGCDMQHHIAIEH